MVNVEIPGLEGVLTLCGYTVRISKGKLCGSYVYSSDKLIDSDLLYALDPVYEERCLLGIYTLKEE